MVEEIEQTLGQGRSCLLEAVTGTGKTISSLSAIIPLLHETEERRLLYLVRTNSQQQQVMVELRALDKVKGLDLAAVALQGRSTLCPQAELDPELARSNADEHSRLCGKLKTRAIAAADAGQEEGGCSYYRRLYQGGPELVQRWSKEYLGAEAFLAQTRAAGLCPYELNKLRLAKARIIVAPYIFYFHPAIRRHLMDWLGARPSELVVVIDEAHNLPDYACGLASKRMNLTTMLRASTEADHYGLAFPGGEAVAPFISTLEAAMEALADRYIPQEEQEGLLPHQTLGWDSGLPTLETELMELAGVTLKTLHERAEGLVMLGAAVREQKLARGKRPRSYLGAVGDFLHHWLANTELHQVRLVAEAPELALESACLDPSVVTNILNHAAGALLMSGTLAPLGHYRDLLGLAPDTHLATYESPFPPENRRAHYLLDVTTRYAELSSNAGLWQQLQEHLLNTLEAFAGNAAVFYPSYHLLERSLEGLKAAGLAKPLYVEQSGMEQEELMSTVETFKSDTNSVLLGVMGGRLAEGIDYPDSSLELALLFGIPYSPPSARQRALVTYYDLKFVGRGWEYAVKAPATRKLLQAIGRLIRSPTDRGLAIILDRRATNFKGYIKDLQAVADPVWAMQEFFKET